MIELVDTYQLEIMALELSIDRDQLDEGLEAIWRKNSLEKSANIIEGCGFPVCGKQQEVIRAQDRWLRSW